MNIEHSERFYKELPSYIKLAPLKDLWLDGHIPVIGDKTVKKYQWEENNDHLAEIMDLSKKCLEELNSSQIEDTEKKEARNVVQQTLQNCLTYKMQTVSDASMLSFKQASSRESASTSVGIFGNITNTPEGQRALIESVKLAAQQDGGLVSRFIQNYGIKGDTPEGQAALIGIAKLAAKQNREALSEFIQNYGIEGDNPEGQAALIEIAKLAAQQNEKALSEFIQNYGIKGDTPEGQAALIEIAKLAAKRYGKAVSEFIRNYGIKGDNPEGQVALIEIAKLATQFLFGGVSEFIQNYGIKDDTPEGQAALIEIAKLAAKRNGKALSKFIQNYGIKGGTPEGQATLIEIAKLAAQYGVGSVSEFIQNYGIKDDTPEGQAALIEIAKLAAKQNGKALSEFIQNYGIKGDNPEGQAALIEIAKLAARQNGVVVSAFIENYGIKIDNAEGQAALIEIVILAAQQHPAAISAFIKNYSIDNVISLGKEVPNLVFKKAAQNYDKSVSNTEDLASIKSAPIKIGTFFDSFLEIYPILGGSGGVSVECLKTFYAESKTCVKIEGFEKLIESVSDQGFMKSLLRFIVNTALKEGVATFVQEVPLINKEPSLCHLLTKINAIQDPNLRQQSMDALITSFFISSAKEGIATQDSETASSSEKTGHALPESHSGGKVISRFKHLCETYNQPHHVLPNFCLSLFKTGSEKHLMTLRSKGGPFLKDAHFAKTLFKMLVALKNGRGLTDAQKDTLVNLVINGQWLIDMQKANLETRTSNGNIKDKLSKNLAIVSAIIALGGGENLASEKKIEDFSEILKKSFSEILPMQTYPENFHEKLEKTFGSFRNPYALVIYAACLKELGGDEATVMLESLAKCVELVVTDQFPACRYDDTRSIHLKTLFSDSPTMKEQWVQGSKHPLGDFLAPAAISSAETLSKVKLPAFHTLLLQSFTQQHVESAQYTLLYEYLNASTKEAKIASSEKLDAMFEDSENPLFAEEKKHLELQKHLMALASCEGGVNSALALLEKAIEVLPTATSKHYFRQFNADISGLLTSLKNLRSRDGKASTYEKWTIEDTDDLCDLFLCGTEVEGSCQSINGNSDLNKCLLGYVMDGKNRLLAIKDSTGKIQARMIERLLWDEKNNKPVLFIERVYPAICEAAFAKALFQLAKERAKALGVPLASFDNVEEQTDEPIDLCSLSGEVFEYTDSGGGVYPNGIFTIPQAYCIDLK